MSLNPPPVNNPQDPGSAAPDGQTTPSEVSPVGGTGGAAAPGMVAPIAPSAPPAPVPSDAVRYSAQALTDPQKTQARANIGMSGGGRTVVVGSVDPITLLPQESVITLVGGNGQEPTIVVPAETAAFVLFDKRNAGEPPINFSIGFQNIGFTEGAAYGFCGVVYVDNTEIDTPTVRCRSFDAVAPVDTFPTVPVFDNFVYIGMTDNMPQWFSVGEALTLSADMVNKRWVVADAGGVLYASVPCLDGKFFAWPNQVSLVNVFTGLTEYQLPTNATFEWWAVMAGTLGDRVIDPLGNIWICTRTGVKSDGGPDSSHARWELLTERAITRRARNFSPLDLDPLTLFHGVDHVTGAPIVFSFQEMWDGLIYDTLFQNINLYGLSSTSYFIASHLQATATLTVRDRYITANHSITNDDVTVVVTANAPTITLPAAGSSYKGRLIYIKNLSASAATLSGNIDGVASGSANHSLTNKQCITLQCVQTGTTTYQWIVISKF